MTGFTLVLRDRWKISLLVSSELINLYSPRNHPENQKMILEGIEVN